MRDPNIKELIVDRKTGDVRPRKRRTLTCWHNNVYKTMSVQRWSKLLGISINTIYSRLKRGCFDAEALQPPVHVDSTACRKGHVYTLHEHDSALDSYYTDNRGQKVCKECASRRAADYRARKLEREANEIANEIRAKKEDI